MKTNIYIDGFNLYYGALKDTPYKWLNPELLCERILSTENEIQDIKLFTAKVKPTITDKDAHQRQQIYLRALKHHIPNLEIIYGHFMEQPLTAPLCDERGKLILKRGRPQMQTICKREEKGSDVNLALHFLFDALHNQYECGVIISNDSDLSEAVKLVRNYTDKVIGVITPFDTASKELSHHAHFTRKIRNSALKTSQLPGKISGTKIKKPKSW